MALSKRLGPGVIALIVVVLGQLLLEPVCAHTPTWLEIAISGLGVFHLLGCGGRFHLPCNYRNDQYR